MQPRRSPKQLDAPGGIFQPAAAADVRLKIAKGR